jgi:hypothetical protein
MCVSPAHRLEDYSLEFEEFWKAYPRRIEKKKAYKSFLDSLKEGIDTKEFQIGNPKTNAPRLFFFSST